LKTLISSFSNPMRIFASLIVHIISAIKPL